MALKWNVGYGYPDGERMPGKGRKQGGKVRRLRLIKWQEQHGMCYYCGMELTITEATLDHVVAKAKGGKLTYENTVVACWLCNQRKGSKLMEQGKCKSCNAPILYLNTKRHINFGGAMPPVQKDDLCPKCWQEANPNEPIPQLPGWSI